jgi:hypothetical protein
MKPINFGRFTLASVPWVHNGLGVNGDGNTTSTASESAVLRFFLADNYNVNASTLMPGSEIVHHSGRK